MEEPMLTATAVFAGPFLGMGVPELIIILVVALLIFGPKNLPKLGSALGKTVKNVREGLEGSPAISDGDDDDDDDDEAEDGKPAPKKAAPKKK
jgi:sec-independent protein translocase protein TatA